MKVSIIIPVYNSEEFLEECLNSVIGQTLNDIEILCIDDCSTDNSLNILRNYAGKDKRVKIFCNNEHLGAALSRNVGLMNAQGEYIAFVDSDDCIVNNFCEVLYENCKCNGLDLILFNSIEYNFKGKRERVYFAENLNYENLIFDWHIDKNLILNKFFVIWSKFYKKDLLDDIEFYNLPILEDVLFHVETMLKAKKISYLPEFLYVYKKLNKNSLQNSKYRTKESFVIFDVFNHVKDILNKYDCFDDFTSNFIKFQINESRNMYFNIDLLYKEEAYLRIKNLFKKFEFSENEFNDLNMINQNFFKNICCSENLVEFNDLFMKENIDIINSLNNDKLDLKFKIIELNNAIDTLKYNISKNNEKIEKLESDLHVSNELIKDYIHIMDELNKRII